MRVFFLLLRTFDCSVCSLYCLSPWRSSLVAVMVLLKLWIVLSLLRCYFLVPYLCRAEKPQMFTAYYLIYATIFGFLVVERASRLKLKHLFTNPVTRWLDSLGTIDLHMLTPNSLFLGVLGVGMMMWKSVLKRLQRSRRSARTWRKKADKRVSKRKTSTRNGVFNVVRRGTKRRERGAMVCRSGSVGGATFAEKNSGLSLADERRRIGVNER